MKCSIITLLNITREIKSHAAVIIVYILKKNDREAAKMW